MEMMQFFRNYPLSKEGAKKNHPPGRRFSRKSAIVCLAAASFVGPALAEAADVLVALPTEEDFLGDIPVVLSATRLAQPKSDAPASITIIDRDMIEASGIRTIPELLRLVPGFQVGHDYGSLLAPLQTPVTYHGYSDAFSRKMQVLVDGRSVYEPFIGGVRWSELGLVLDDVDRIEVIRGPNGASYGSNAVLGAINIITRHPSQDSGTTFGMDVDSRGKRLGTVSHSNVDGKNNYRWTAFYTQDPGFEGRNDSKNTTGITYRGEVKLENKDSIDVFLGLNQGSRQLGDDPYPSEYPYHDGEVSSHYQQVRWTRRNSADNELSVQFYHNYFQFNNMYTGNLLGVDVTSDAGSRTNRWDLEFQQVKGINRDFRFVWGLGARVDEAQAPGWFGTNDWVQNIVYRVFVNGEWHPSEKWTVNIGALAEQSTVAETTVSPRLAANYHLSQDQTLRAAVSRGYRNPALFEEHADTTVFVGPPVSTTLYYFFSDGSVKAANVTNYELGYLKESSKGKVSMDAKLFLMQFRGSIAYALNSDPPDYSVPYAHTYLNGGESDIYGAEFQFKWMPTRRTTTTFSYAYAKHEGWYVAVLPSTRGESGQTTPNHTFSVLLDQKISDHWSAGFFYHHVSNMAWFGGNPTNGYHIVNARLGREFNLGSGKGRFEIVGQNLAGDYSDLHDSTISNRKLFIGVRLPI